MLGLPSCERKRWPFARIYSPHAGPTLVALWIIQPAHRSSDGHIHYETVQRLSSADGLRARPYGPPGRAAMVAEARRGNDMAYARLLGVW